jgi:OOP family OmpA-OmpF porin
MNIFSMRAYLFFLLAVVLPGSIFAATGDKEGSRDYPLFSRMPNFHIDSYDEQEFGAYDKFVDGNGNRITVEGHKFLISYYLDKGATKPSDIQILRNFTSAIEKIGGTVVKENPTNAYLKVEKGGNTTWIHVRTKNRGEGYVLNIVEKQGMKQDIVADATSLARDIQMKGKVAVYGIYFDTGKSEVKQESEPALQEIAKLLKNDPSLSLYVVGHTDTVGELEFNMQLSRARADSVVSFLISRFKVDAARLKPHGVGPLAPVASNSTDEGRALNRRVELVER